jgi:hypothetical protein
MLLLLLLKYSPASVEGPFVFVFLMQRLFVCVYLFIFGQSWQNS